MNTACNQIYAHIQYNFNVRTFGPFKLPDVLSYIKYGMIQNIYSPTNLLEMSQNGGQTT